MYSFINVFTIPKAFHSFRILEDSFSNIYNWPGTVNYIKFRVEIQELIKAQFSYWNAIGLPDHILVENTLWFPAPIPLCFYYIWVQKNTIEKDLLDKHWNRFFRYFLATYDLKHDCESIFNYLWNFIRELSEVTACDIVFLSIRYWVYIK